jgi:hypothetical protein
MMECHLAYHVFFRSTSGIGSTRFPLEYKWTAQSAQLGYGNNREQNGLPSLSYSFEPAPIARDFSYKPERSPTLTPGKVKSRSGEFNSSIANLY